MKSLYINSSTLRFGLAACAVIAAGLSISQQPAFAVPGPALTIDIVPTGTDINAAIAAPTGNHIAAASGATESFDIWFVVTAGSSGAANNQLGILNSYYQVLPTVSGTFGGSNLTNANTAGQNTGNGPLTGAYGFTDGNNDFLGTFGGAYQSGSQADGTDNLAGEFGDLTNSKVNAVGGTSQSQVQSPPQTGSALIQSEAGGSTKVNIGGNPNKYGGEALSGAATGWAFDVATVNLQLPTITSGSMVLTFTPGATGASFSGAHDQWTVSATHTVSGGQPIVASNGTLLSDQTSSADALQSGLGIQYTITAGPSGPTPATVDNSGVLGANGVGFNAAPVTFPVAASNGSYAGLASQVTTSSQTSNGGGGIEGTIATILAGTNTGSATNVGMAWRTRFLTELPNNDSINPTVGNNTFSNNVGNTNYGPPLRGLPLISDVVNLFGMGTAAEETNSTITSINTLTQTDPFALQMNFNPATLKAEGATNANMATRGELYLASLISGVWQNTITGNFAIPAANTTTTNYNGQMINIGVDTLASMPNGINRPYEGTFAAWETQFDPGLVNPLSDYIGVWGVDADTLATGEYNAWAIVNHNSDFAVVPEPSTIVLAGLGLLGGALALRRKKQATQA